jgi:pectin methylesterase-like acyl-CoA thioesterase
MKKLLTLLSLTAALGICAAHAADAPRAPIVVAQDGSGDYTRVQDAIDAAPPNQTAPTIIYTKENIFKADTTTAVELKGDCNPTVAGIATIASRYAKAPPKAAPGLQTPERTRVLVTTARELTRSQQIVCHTN